MKKLNKKLTLNKETIASLNNEQMYGIKGGLVEMAGKTKRKKPPCWYTEVTQ